MSRRTSLIQCTAFTCPTFFPSGTGQSDKRYCRGLECRHHYYAINRMIRYADIWSNNIRGQWYLTFFGQHCFFLSNICILSLNYVYLWYFLPEVTNFWKKYPEGFKEMIHYFKPWIHNNIIVYTANFGYQLWDLNNH